MSCKLYNKIWAELFDEFRALGDYASEAARLADKYVDEEYQRRVEEENGVA